MLAGIGESAELSKLNIKTIVDLPDVGKNLQVLLLYSSHSIYLLMILLLS